MSSLVLRARVTSLVLVRVVVLQPAACAAAGYGGMRLVLPGSAKQGGKGRHMRCQRSGRWAAAAAAASGGSSRHMELHSACLLKVMKHKIGARAYELSMPAAHNIK